MDFSGDCTSDRGGITELQANGTISVGELQTCNALNDFNITSSSNPPPIPAELDMAIVNFGNGDVSIRLGNGDGTFNSTALDVPVGGRPQSIAVGFFNADSNLDLAVVNQAPNVVSIRLGNGDGTFNSTAPNVGVGNVPISIAVGLFNADSNLDLAVANDLDGDVSIRLGNGDGTFTLPNNSPPDVAVGTNPSSIAVGDFDNK